jgi:hypothetical protein
MSVKVTPTIRTFTGLQVNPLDLKPADIHINDIAHALSLCNRFAGHTIEPISVAQHSINVYRRVLATAPGPSVETTILRQALIHDATEAYLGDVTKWLKGHDCMAGYRDFEAKAWEVIAAVFQVPVDLHPLVEAADRFMVKAEGTSHEGFADDKFLDWHPNYPPLTVLEKDWMDQLYFGSIGHHRTRDHFIKLFEGVKV